MQRGFRSVSIQKAQIEKAFSGFSQLDKTESAEGYDSYYDSTKDKDKSEPKK